MLLNRANLPLILVIYINIYIRCTTAIDFTVKVINFDYGNKLLTDRHHFASPGMVFGQCDDTERLVSKRLCTFILETNEPINSGDHLRTCDIELKVDGNRKIIGKVHNVTGFGGSKAILTYEEQFCYKFAIIDFSGCQVYYGNTDGICMYQPDIVSVRDDALIDIIERGNSKSLCKGVKYCRMIMDAEGNVVTPLNKWKTVEGDIISTMFSPNHGRLIAEIRQSDSSVQIRTVGSDNEGRFPTAVVKEYYCPRTLPFEIIASNTHQHLTVCHESHAWSPDSDESVCACSQFNENGDLMFFTSQKFTIGTASTRVHNLPNGGILLLIQSCALQSSNTCKTVDDDMLIATKIDRTGDLAGSIGISQYRFDEGLKLDHLNFYVNEEGQYCLSAAQADKDNDRRVNMSIVCFNEEELKISDHWTSAM